MSRAVAVLALVFSGLAGCQSEVPPEMVEAEIVAAGRYEIEQGQPRVVDPDTRIPCRLGAIFGVDYRITSRDGSRGLLPVTLRWTHPEIEVPAWRPSPVETPAGGSTLRIEAGESAVIGRALWSIAEPGELVAGRYVFEIRLQPAGGTDAATPADSGPRAQGSAAGRPAEVVLSQAFELVDCP